MLVSTVFCMQWLLGVMGPFLLVWENRELSSHGPIHIKAFSDSETAQIMDNEVLEAQTGSSDSVSDIFCHEVLA